MAAQFVTDAGEAPYAGLHGEAVPDELRILSLDEVLDYLTAAGEFRYIIEIKDGGETGLAAADQLYATLQERGICSTGSSSAASATRSRPTSRPTTPTPTAAPARRRSCSSILPP